MPNNRPKLVPRRASIEVEASRSRKDSHRTPGPAPASDERSVARPPNPSATAALRSALLGSTPRQAHARARVCVKTLLPSSSLSNARTRRRERERETDRDRHGRHRSQEREATIEPGEGGSAAKAGRLSPNRGVRKADAQGEEEGDGRGRSLRRGQEGQEELFGGEARPLRAKGRAPERPGRPAVQEAESTPKPPATAASGRREAVGDSHPQREPPPRPGEAGGPAAAGVRSRPPREGASATSPAPAIPRERGSRLQPPPPPPPRRAAGRAASDERWPPAGWIHARPRVHGDEIQRPSRSVRAAPWGDAPLPSPAPPPEVQVPPAAAAAPSHHLPSLPPGAWPLPRPPWQPVPGQPKALQGQGQ